jgi:hypothetical protein
MVHSICLRCFSAFFALALTQPLSAFVKALEVLATDRNGV